jgi:hypothetical protein
MQAFPTISFYCSCGKQLYKVSTNILAYWDDLKCPKCGREYVSRNSLIAVAVPVFAGLEKSVRNHSSRNVAVHKDKTVEQNRAAVLSKTVRKRH